MNRCFAKNLRCACLRCVSQAALWATASNRSGPRDLAFILIPPLRTEKCPPRSSVLNGPDWIANEAHPSLWHCGGGLRSSRTISGWPCYLSLHFLPCLGPPGGSGPSRVIFITDTPPRVFLCGCDKTEGRTISINSSDQIQRLPNIGRIAWMLFGLCYFNSRLLSVSPQPRCRGNLSVMRQYL